MRRWAAPQQKATSLLSVCTIIALKSDVHRRQLVGQKSEFRRDSAKSVQALSALAAPSLPLRLQRSRRETEGILPHRGRPHCRLRTSDRRGAGSFQFAVGRHAGCHRCSGHAGQYPCRQCPRLDRVLWQHALRKRQAGQGVRRRGLRHPEHGRRADLPLLREGSPGQHPPHRTAGRHRGAHQPSLPLRGTA